MPVRVDFLTKPDAKLVYLTFYHPDMDIISIHNMQVSCFIGIHRHERHERQTLLVDLDMHVETARAGNEASLGSSVDYSKIHGELKFLLEACHFRLLETAAQALSSYLLAPPPSDREQAQIHAVTLTLRKPSALKSEAIPGLKVHRTRDDINIGLEVNNFGEVDLIHESQDCGIYRLRIPAGGRIPAHYHQVMAEGEMALSDGLLLQGSPLTAGLAHFWPQQFVHQYDNPTDAERTVLCVNRPAFIPSDEIPASEGFILSEPPDSTKIRFF
jgi:FolB domain-containing protein